MSHAKFPPSSQKTELAHLQPLKKIRQIMSLGQRHSAAIERLCGINGAQLWILSELGRTPKLRVNEIATLLAAHQSTVSNLVDDLIKKGLVSKSANPKDRRVMLVALTELGQRTLEDAPSPTRGVLPHALLQMDDARLKELDKSLQHLIDAIKEIDESLGLDPLPFNLAAR